LASAVVAAVELTELLTVSMPFVPLATDVDALTVLIPWVNCAYSKCCAHVTANQLPQSTPTIFIPCMLGPHTHTAVILMIYCTA
jgi:hypothetical protein